MTPEQAQIIKLTFAQVMRNKDKVGVTFYDRLFTIAPEVRPLFKGDVAEQSRKLMDTLALAVGMLREMPTLMMTLQGLARRHVATASGTSTTTRSARRCCGPSRRASATPSRRRSATPGRRSTRRWRRSCAMPRRAGLRRWPDAKPGPAPVALRSV